MLCYPGNTNLKISGGILDSCCTKSLLETVYNPADTVTQGGVTEIYPAIYSQKFSLLLTKIDSNSQSTWFEGAATADRTFLFIADDALSLLETYHLHGTATNYGNWGAFNYSTLNTARNIIIPSISIEGKKLH
jgi:hypothetical protein